ncbi:glycoside hydrolase family 72 protein [Lophiostoma macrostomum CBS 122681]|uniref:1,3-beta-glucanosyltransferase n=1 Tax=Lophiostoma macrostomum CBS 122681 TaxID=1314788 RepID=A0A6A6SJS6_9PLEO|nr:glycoside hydrolase family 72 protein [Lophiostoma macrostomum CBS 122681]
MYRERRCIAMSGHICFAVIVPALILVSSRVVQALPTISTKGSKFFTSDGDQFYIKGIVYQFYTLGTNLVNGDQCKIDADAISELGANLVSVYAVDPTVNHDECMEAFEEKGIYVMIYMSTPSFTINIEDPEWTIDLRNAFADIVDAFQAYDNLFGFFASSMIVNNVESSAAAPYAKAVIADMKAYRDLMQYRKMPMGYAATDVAALRLRQQKYFACGNSSIAADFYGLRRYSWYGSNSTFTASGYDELYDDAENYPIPIILAETGKNNDSGTTPYRVFDDQESLLGKQMNDRYSGSIIYEWPEEANNCGLVSYSDSWTLTGSVTAMGDFTRLKEQWATLTPVGVEASDYNPTLSAPSCPDYSSGTWSVMANAALPTVGMYGFTAPTGSTGMSGRTVTGSGTAVTETDGSDKSSSDSASGRSDRVAVGAIVGGVVGGIAIIALLLSGVCLLRRRKRQRGTGLPSRDELVNPESDKMVAGSEEIGLGDYEPKRHHEMSGTDPISELDPFKGDIATMRANEMSNGHQMNELQDAQQEIPRGDRGDSDVPLDSISTSQSASANDVGSPSPFVHAQRRMEVDWLESEEARLRQRREVLLSQSRATNA